MPDDRKICVGLIAGAHGVQGFVRLRSFTEDPESIFEYPLTDEKGERKFALSLKGVAKDHYMAALKGVTDREEAEALRGTRLYVTRALLPKLKKREYYEADLIGLIAKDGQKKDCGKIVAVHNYGGGPFLEITLLKGKNFMLPFTDTFVPEVDIEEGYAVIMPPEGWTEEQKPEKPKGRAA